MRPLDISEDIESPTLRGPGGRRHRRPSSIGCPGVRLPQHLSPVYGWGRVSFTDSPRRGRVPGVPLRTRGSIYFKDQGPFQHFVR